MLTQAYSQGVQWTEWVQVQPQGEKNHFSTSAHSAVAQLCYRQYYYYY